ncbi:MAG: hypothetical protein ACFHW5_05485 [Verrucomicrobiota bacterium]
MIKKTLRKTIGIIWSEYLRLKWNLNQKNNENKKLLHIYTDSRGYFINGVKNYKNPYKTYINNIANWSVSYQYCLHRSTTLLDFLIDTENIKCDTIVLHCGIVDWSPRTLSHCQKIIYRLNKSVHRIQIPTLHPNKLSQKYNNQETFNLYSIDFFKEKILPVLTKRKNIIYIGVNPVLTNWRGNYFRERPKNINVILDYDKLLTEAIPSIRIRNWTKNQIKNFTVDNIHLSEAGMLFLNDQLNLLLNNVND